MRGLPFCLRAILFHAVFVGLDHLFDHLSADRTGLTGGQVAVVALLEVYANFVSSLHLKTIERFARLRDDAGITTSSHFVIHSLFQNLLFAFAFLVSDDAVKI